jgi:hypothetical protein
MRKLIVMLVMLMVSAIMIAQTAIIVPAHPRTGKKGATFTNSQGFILPKSVSDTTKVYQSSKGAQYYFRKSAKSGLIYKVYMPKKGV